MTPVPKTSRSSTGYACPLALATTRTGPEPMAMWATVPVRVRAPGALRATLTCVRCSVVAWRPSRFMNTRGIRMNWSVDADRRGL